MVVTGPIFFTISLQQGNSKAFKSTSINHKNICKDPASFAYNFNAHVLISTINITWRTS